ncbi:MAG: hypothetical protein QOD61_1002, partial [Solirubrobacteraceae bacterium]|nr:hypothetical protein [Solirubrobacteraceae bacterium]
RAERAATLGHLSEAAAADLTVDRTETAGLAQATPGPGGPAEGTGPADVGPVGHAGVGRQPTEAGPPAGEAAEADQANSAVEPGDDEPGARRKWSRLRPSR